MLSFSFRSGMALLLTAFGVAVFVLDSSVCRLDTLLPPVYPVDFVFFISIVPSSDIFVFVE